MSDSTPSTHGEHTAMATAPAMYCHGCHHQWRREGGSIECPACQSSSTEIVRESPPRPDDTTVLTVSPQITSADDPRQFHSRQSDPADSEAASLIPPAPAAVPLPVYGPERPPGSPQPSSTTFRRGTQPAESTTPPAPSHGHPNTIHQFIFAPITFHFTAIVPGAPPSQPEPTQIATPHTMMWHFITTGPSPVPPPAPSPGPTEPATTEPQPQDQSQTEDNSSDQQQSQPESNSRDEQERQSPDIAPETIPRHLGPMLALFFGDSLRFGSFGNGDVVYSQEAFDRVMTRLREANAHAGGAPPASQAAIDKLTTKEVDDQMLQASEGNAKCVICLDDMAKGDKASVLPCNHFFHGGCVTTWLKQHNTCPVCRRSIEDEVTSKTTKTVDEFQQHQHHEHEHEHHENAPNATGCM